MTLNILILGASGQDGSYATDNLLARGHNVYAAIRKAATSNTKNLQKIIDSPPSNFNLERFDLSDESSIYSLISSTKPDLIFNYADQDHVSWSHSLPIYSCDITARAVNVILEAIKLLSPNSLLIQPISSNIFGNSNEEDISEKSLISPLSPYGISKATALYLCRYYRSAYDLQIINPILFNHESERRTKEYVTRKISLTASLIKANRVDKITLGDTSARIDWGYAPEYVDLMINLAISKQNDEFIIGTGSLFSVHEFANACFDRLDLNLEKYLEIDKKLIRPTKNKPLKANIKKVNSVSGYFPKIYGKDLAHRMVDNDIKTISND